MMIMGKARGKRRKGDFLLPNHHRRAKVQESEGLRLRHRRCPRCRRRSRCPRCPRPRHLQQAKATVRKVVVRVN